MASTPMGQRDAAQTEASRSSKAGWALSGLAIAVLTADAAGKLLVPEMMIANSPPLGLPADSEFHRLLRVILGLSTLLYTVQRTAFVGALLLTAYLGGAVATHLRVDSPLISHTLFGVYVGATLWGGLWLRDARVRALLS